MILSRGILSGRILSHVGFCPSGILSGGFIGGLCPHIPNGRYFYISLSNGCCNLLVV